MASFANTSASGQQRRYCPDCEEDYLTEGAYCLVCGAEIILLPASTTASEISNNPSFINPEEQGTDENLAAYLDLFGIDFQDLLQRFSSSSNNRVLSQDYASTLGKVDVDVRFTILFNYIIRIGPLKVNSVPAQFSPLSVKDALEAPLVIASPICGEGPLVNADEVQGSIVLMERGVVSFAHKCQQAKACGAVGVIVAQNNAKWPFVMADSANELCGEEVDIPVCMVSQTDGELLFKWVRSKQTATTTAVASSASLSAKSVRSTLIILNGEEMPRECSICQDNIEVNENVLRLSCCHSFHSECIMTWLRKNNNCPMCRHEMPSVTVKNGAIGRRGNEDIPISHRQNYFA